MAVTTIYPSDYSLIALVGSFAIRRRAPRIDGHHHMQFVSVTTVAAVVLFSFGCGAGSPTPTTILPTPATAPPTATPLPPTPTLTPDQLIGKEIKKAALDYLETVMLFQSSFEALVFEISASGKTGFSVTFEDELIDELLDAELAIENTSYSVASGHSWSTQFETMIDKGQKLVDFGMEDVGYILDEISLGTDEAEVLMADVLWAADESEVAAEDFRAIAAR